MSQPIKMKPRLVDKIEYWLPKVVMSPTVFLTMVFIYGFIIWTTVLSFTKSRILPVYDFVGFQQYVKLFLNDRWMLALKNLAIFGILFIVICLFVGLLLAILLDQKIRAEGFIRTVYLYPMALSFIVTGTVWKWLLNPTVGIERFVQSLGFESFSFDWLVNPDMAIYTIVIAGVWQSSGFVMALFLAGLRGVDNSIIKAAQIDGASMVTIYSRIIIPSLRPVFFSAIIMLAHIAIKSFDLIVALTGGGPGNSTDVPAIFMYQFSFTRSQMGVGAASAVVMLMGIIAILVPFLYSELRATKNV
ncbi:carbohydrate ABC transporter permease [Gynuella sunshinyii]|uniref:ABC-type sugar transport system, permease component n=1 Tax=Gynuella sunshinyii YC6258 TaxID=1445510 RepID=A0A0C5VID8_9GAMM|nr:sugar ABC transporter permease [Gynuella sunshinyii]AJQ93118.1 ABC-type sugar transport system, permease component [Gynuella sunshinyii YC6258]